MGLILGTSIVCVCVCVVYVCACASVSVFVCVYVCVCAYMYASVCLYICVLIFKKIKIISSPPGVCVQAAREYSALQNIFPERLRTHPTNLGITQLLELFRCVYECVCVCGGGSILSI